MRTKRPNDRSSIRRVLLLPVVIFASGCSSVLEPEDPTDIGAWLELYDGPGAAVAVINDFELDYVEVHGVMSRATREPVTEETLFQAASLSKGVSAVGVLSLAEDGLVSLDREINDYLTSWELPDNPLQQSEKVTLRRLLSHTAGTTVSGFRGYRIPEPVPTLIQVLDGVPPANSEPIVVDLVPGSRFRYSGGGYLVMQQAVMDVTGQAFEEFIDERVLRPAGMTRSTYVMPLPASRRAYAASGYYADGTPVPGGRHIYPETAAASLWTTPADVARFLIDLQLSLRGDPDRILTRESAELAIAEVKRDYGLGFDLWTQRGQAYFGHYGANDGFRGRMIAHRFAGYGVVILTNSDNGHEFADAVARVIGKREGWPGY